MSRPFSLLSFTLDPLADFARTAKAFEAAFNPRSFPAYDVVRVDESAIALRFALAGYAANELDVSIEGSELRIAGSKAETGDAAPEYLHRGIAQRSFERRFELAEHAEVESALLADGILTIRVRVQKPEISSRKIEIAAAA